MLIKYIATAHEHTSHDTRRGHGTREARTDGERADRKMTVGQGLTEDETRRRRTRKAKGQIARRDDGRFTRRAHTETLIASREHTHETDTLTHTTTADRNGDRVPKRSESVKGETAGT